MFRIQISKLPLLARLYLLVAAADLLGALVAIPTGLAPVGRTIVSGTPINAPFPALVVQLAIVTAAVGWRGQRTGTFAAAVLVITGIVSLVSGFGDGGYAASLTLLQRAVQIAVVTATMLTLPVAARQVITAARTRRVRTASASL